MILIAALAMTTMAAQAEQMNASTDAVMSMSTETPATDTDGDTNGTEQEEATPEGK